MTNAQEQQTQGAALVRRDTVEVVAEKVRKFQESGQLHLPANYSAENAIKSAWLILQAAVDKTGKPVLQACTQASIANALLDMVVQGLNPSKKQGYFIAYGNQLAFQRSYFGAMAVCKRITGAKDIDAQVVWKGDEFEYGVVNGRKAVIKHVQRLENVGGEIVAAYCIIDMADGRQVTDIMTMDQIRQSWKKSKMSPDADTSTHKQYPEEMARKTVINRACKVLINSSSDDNLFLESFNRADEVMGDEDLAEEIAANANGAVIDVHVEETEESPNTSPEPHLAAQNGSPLGRGQNSGGTAKQETPVGTGPGF